MAEAYETLKDREKRAAYDQLGSHAQGQEFRPPPDWEQHFARGQASFDDIDLADLFAGLGGRGGFRRADPNAPVAGRDYEASVRVTLEQAFHGTEVQLDVSVPEFDDERRRAPGAARRDRAHSARRDRRPEAPRAGQGWQGRARRPRRRPLPRHRGDAPPAVPRGRARPLCRSSAGAVGGGARRQHRAADARRNREPQGAGRGRGPDSSCGWRDAGSRVRTARRATCSRSCRSPCPR